MENAKQFKNMKDMDNILRIENTKLIREIENINSSINYRKMNRSRRPNWLLEVPDRDFSSEGKNIKDIRLTLWNLIFIWKITNLWKS